MRLQAAPYTQWECWLNGMYQTHRCRRHVAAVVDLMRDPLVLDAMAYTVAAWPVAFETHLVLRDATRIRPWVGQSTSRHTVGAVATETRQAWGLLTDKERDAANAAADHAIAAWLRTRANQGTFHA